MLFRRCIAMSNRIVVIYFLLWAFSLHCSHSFAPSGAIRLGGGAKKSFLIANSHKHDSSSKEDDDDDEGSIHDIPIDPSSASVNVLGTPLAPCCTNVGNTGIGTGFYRNGYCSTGEQDTGRHTVCVQVTDALLAYSKSVGNDLSTPVPEFLFPGLREGDIWCLCAQRWAQALHDNQAPRVFLRSTHEKTLNYVDFEYLRLYALDGEEADAALRELDEQRDKLNKLL